ncbi:MAG: 30S ribosome-binding factor RbfA [Thermovirgaceae bacterium]|nr:30S ribosome-binding factor RbfA [Thermovirgaceae bacterium]
MPGFRIERINRELLREISDLIHTRVKNDEIKQAVLSEVECSRDLSHAKVYFRTLTPDTMEKVKKSLERSAGLLRGLLGRRMNLRKIPELHFIYDNTEDKARYIEAILDKLDIPDDQGSQPEDDKG